MRLLYIFDIHNAFRATNVNICGQLWLEVNNEIHQGYLAQGTNKSSWESENGISAVKLNSISPYLSWIAWFMWLENRSNHHQAGRQMCHEWAHYKMFHCFLTPLYVLSDVIATHSGLWKLYPPSLFSRQAYTVIFPSQTARPTTP